MKKNMIKAMALVSMLAGSCLQAGVTFYNNSDRLIRVEGFGGISWPIQAGASREFQAGLQDTVTIKNRDSAADKQYGAYKYRVRRSVRAQREKMGRAGERVHLKKAFFDGSKLVVEGRIGKDDTITQFNIMREPVKTKHKKVVKKEYKYEYESKSE